MRPSFSS